MDKAQKASNANANQFMLYSNQLIVFSGKYIIN
jgi:hypothetical protein